MFIINHLLHPLTINAKKHLSEKAETVSVGIGVALYTITGVGLIFARKPQLLKYTPVVAITSFYAVTAYFKKVMQDKN